MDFSHTSYRLHEYKRRKAQGKKKNGTPERACAKKHKAPAGCRLFRP